MLCQNCNQRMATVYFTQIVNNEKVEMYLCEQCAKERNAFSINIPMGISNFFAGFTGMPAELPYARDEQQTVCEGCGMKYEEFLKTGKMGCSECYEVYGERIKPLLKRIHGSVSHTGKAPKKVRKSLKISSEIDSLKKELDEAVRKEEYEKAAELRDRIRDMEKSTSESENSRGGDS